MHGAEFNRIEVRMRTSAGSEIATVYFITDQDANWDEAKARHFSTVSDGEYHIYTIDLSDLLTWQGRILQLRFDPRVSPGDFEIDYFYVTRP